MDTRSHLKCGKEQVECKSAIQRHLRSEILAVKIQGGQFVFMHQLSEFDNYLYFIAGYQFPDTPYHTFEAYYRDRKSIR